MHLFEFAFYLCGTYLAVFVRQTILYLFITIIALYLLLSTVMPNSQTISSRKKIMLATWKQPEVGGALVRLQLRVDRVLKIIEDYPEEKRPSLTHFVIKAVGEVLRFQPQLNGSLIFGKFLPYKTVDVSCLVNIDEGKDLARIVLKNVDKIGVEDIRDIVKKQSQMMKKDGGGQEHRNSISSLKFMPAFLIDFITPIIFFFYNRVGVDLKIFNQQIHNFGAIIVTSIGSLNIQDVSAPLLQVANVSGVVSLGKITREPVVQGDRIEIGRVCQINFMIDQRYLDLGRSSKFTSSVKQVFAHPQKFMKAPRSK